MCFLIFTKSERKQVENYNELKVLWALSGEQKQLYLSSDGLTTGEMSLNSFWNTSNLAERIFHFFNSYLKTDATFLRICNSIVLYLQTCFLVIIWRRGTSKIHSGDYCMHKSLIPNVWGGFVILERSEWFDAFLTIDCLFIIFYQIIVLWIVNAY